MRTIYIDSEYKCHVSNDGTMRAIETDFFDGGCDEFIEGYIYLPNKERMIGKDGKVYDGPMICPWKPYAELDAAQRKYEKQLLAEYAESLRTMGVKV